MTAVYTFHSPRFQPLDDNGEVLPGAQLEFFDTATTTPVAVYADAGLSAELPNPVVADAGGRFPAIYMQPTVTYRVRLLDADDVLLWDVDPYTPPRDWPPGFIAMFYGSAEDRDAAFPPELWQVCNGEGGSPDMRNRVPVGVSSELEPGDTGGEAVSTTSAAGGHDHGGEVSSEVLSAEQMPAHNHRLWVTQAQSRFRAVGWAPGRPVVSVAGSDGGPFAYVNQHQSSSPLVEQSGEGSPEGHDHDITAVADHQHTVSTMPPFVALWFLMRRYPAE